MIFLKIYNFKYNLSLVNISVGLSEVMLCEDLIACLLMHSLNMESFLLASIDIFVFGSLDGMNKASILFNE